MYFCRTANRGDCKATYGLYEDDPGFSWQKKDHAIPEMIVCINPAAGGNYAEFNRPFGVNDTTGCTQLVCTAPRPSCSPQTDTLQGTGHLGKADVSGAVRGVRGTRRRVHRRRGTFRHGARPCHWRRRRWRHCTGRDRRIHGRMDRRRVCSRRFRRGEYSVITGWLGLRQLACSVHAMATRPRAAPGLPAAR